MRKHIMNKRLDFDYFSETDDENHLTVVLDCYNHAIANGIKSKYGNEVNIYNILAQDITLYMETDREMNIDYMSAIRFPNQYIHPVVYENATLEMLEKFLDEDKIVIINTLHHEIKFFKYYNTPYDTTNVPSHPLSIIHHNSENLYYVENLNLINKANYRYYKDNESVGVIEKSYLKPIFDKYLVCITIDIDFNRLDLFDERLFTILKSYVDLSEKEEIINGISYFYGITALNKMIESCSAGNDLCKKDIDVFNEDLINGIKYLFRMRIFMRECLMKLVENKSFIIKDEVMNAFTPSIETWINLVNILIKKNMKKQPLLDKSLVEYFNNLINYEKRLLDFISKLLKYGTAFF